MTGMEAWNVVAPILAAHSVPYYSNEKQKLNAIDEAYVIVYGALKMLDEQDTKKG